MPGFDLLGRRGAGVWHPAPVPRGAGVWQATSLLFGVALLVRLFRLDALSLWLDEGGTWSELSRSWAALGTDLINPRASYPLYHLAMKAWTTLAGDSEWALRFPSALAGAVSVALTFALGARLGKPRAGLLAALVLMFNPAALFYAQDAKVYSLLMAVILVTLLALVRFVEQPTRPNLVRWVGWVLVALFVHRLALLSLIGQVVFLVAAGPLSPRWRRWAWAVPIALAVLLGAGMAWGLRQDPNAPPIGGHADPLTGLVVLWGRLNLDRSPFDVPWQLLALMSVFGIGVWAVWQTARRGERLPALFFCSVGAIPLLVYLLILAAGVPIFEPRYVAFLLPLLALGLGWGLDALALKKPEASNLRLIQLGLMVGAVVLMQGLALFSRPYGLWSGVAIKEDYRTALTTLAERVAPDDAVIVHPPYIKPLYAYYRHRVSKNPLPEPLAFGSTGALNWDQGEFDNDYVTLLAGHRRAWLVIAPINAATVDPPNPLYPQDDMGKVGINFLTADLNGKWRCTDEPWLAFNGVRLLCQSFPLGMAPPSLELTKPWPIPASPTAAWGAMRLLGYEFLPWDSTPYRIGGTLPIHLVWQTAQQVTSSNRIFIHLVPALGAPVAAQRDTAPLYGGLPTPLWPVNQPIHDTVAVPLPSDMQPGRYLVVLGLYDPAIPSIDAQRLPVTEHSAPAGPNFIELGTVEVVR